MGNLVSDAGSIFSGASEQGAANAQKRIARQNAEIAERNADLTMAGGESDAQALGFRNRAMSGALKAHQGASGVDVNSGSALDVQESQHALGMFDQMTLRSNAAREAFGFKVQAKQFRDEAAIAKAKANNAGVSAGINVLSSLVGGASSASSAYSQWENAAAKGESTGLFDSPELAAFLAF